MHFLGDDSQRVSTGMACCWRTDPSRKEAYSTQMRIVFVEASES